VSDLVNPTCYVSTYSDCRRCSRDMFVGGRCLIL
jgi:hypothetical protein